MEIEHNLFLERGRLPGAEQLRALLAEHAPDVRLPEGFDPAADEVVVTLHDAGEPVELEYFANPVDVQELRAEGILRKGEARWLGERDFLISLVAHDERQRRAADALAAVACAACDGQLAVAGEPPFLGAEQAIGWLRSRRQSG